MTPAFEYSPTRFSCKHKPVQASAYMRQESYSRTRTHEKVGLALQRDQLHPLERVCDVVDLGGLEGDEKPVGDKLDVLCH